MSSLNTDTIKTLQAALKKHADPKTRDWWQNYVKKAAPFLGVKMQATRSVLHEWYKNDVAEVHVIYHDKIENQQFGVFSVTALL